MRRTNLLLIGFVSALLLAGCDKEDVISDDQKKESKEGVVIINGHEFVDLGLSNLWATCNVGAQKPGDIGSFYSWGETETKEEHTYSNYKFYDNEGRMTKYFFDPSHASQGVKPDSLSVLELIDDVAYVKWGADCHIPGGMDFKELMVHCTWKWTDEGGVKGYRITSKEPGYTGRSIFLPALRDYEYYDNHGYGRGIYAYYWTRTKPYENEAVSIFIDSVTYTSNYNPLMLYQVASVRPVSPSDEWLSQIRLIITDSVTMAKGAIRRIPVSVKRGDKDYSYDQLDYVSDNPQVVTIDANGMIRAVSAGTAHITVKLRSLSVQCKVTVVEELDIEPEYVDLGLSVKWATFNVGASVPEDFGLYYAWGETEPKTEYTANNYKWNEGGMGYTKYCSYAYWGYNGFTDNKMVLDPEDDVAYVMWGDSWRLPSKAEWQELIDNCNWTRTTVNGTAGYLVTSKVSGYTDRSVFLPAAGFYDSKYLNANGLYSVYLSSWASTDGVDNCFTLYFGGDYLGNSRDGVRWYGYPARPVWPSDEWLSHITLKLESFSIPMGGSSLLHVGMLYDGEDYSYNGSYSWTSDNPEVAKVNDDGTVKALSKGTAHITVTFLSLTAECTVQVVDESEIEHEYVDLGLSVNWATFNVGAAAPQDYGGYYAWGETETKSSYNYKNYAWATAEEWSSSLTKYCCNPENGYNHFTDNKTVLDPDDDVAHVKWGSGWRMPTSLEMQELISNCTWTSTEENGVSGYRITSNLSGYSDRSIFLPAVGEYYDDELSMVDNRGTYWTSTLYRPDYHYYYSDDDRYALYLKFSSNSYQSYSVSFEDRTYGCCVRPVSQSEEWLSHVSLSITTDNISLPEESSKALTPSMTVNGSDYHYVGDYTWSSDNLGVATVDEYGKVTAVSKGTAHITVSTGALSAQCTVTVVDESEIRHEYVDLGLSVNWATFNMGATAPQEMGAGYAWGETSVYNESYNYKWSDNWGFTKYCTDSDFGSNGFTDNKTVLDLEDDAAYVKWGAGWRMPTKAEMEELLNNCTWTRERIGDVMGYRITSNVQGYTDRSIFLPEGGYWTSSLYGDYMNNACGLYIENTQPMSRHQGVNIRPVSPSREWLSNVSVEFEKSSLTMATDGITELSFCYKMNGADYYYPGAIGNPQWSSDNPSVVAVTEKGIIRAVSSGTAHVSVSMEGKTAQCTVTVVDESTITHEYVDLGLSVKWATFNVGATAPQEFGGYFAWGETASKSSYYWTNYKYCHGTDNTLTKYCSNSDSGYEGYTDGKSVLDPEDDVAHVKWGGDWRMPTSDELNELISGCDWKWTAVNNVPGYKVTSRVNSNNYIFLPAAGYYAEDALCAVGNDGDFWASDKDPDGNDASARFLWFTPSGKGPATYSRARAWSVRPVCP